MRGQTNGRLCLFSASLALTACASTNPASSGPPSADTAQVNLAIVSHAAATSDASLTPGLKPGNGYRKVTKNGEEYYCRKVLETGSRTKSQVTCLTRDELTALSQNGQDLLNGIRSVPGSGQGGGALVNSAVSNMNTTP
jgi:hypothetical protein